MNESIKNNNYSEDVEQSVYAKHISSMLTELESLIELAEASSNSVEKLKSELEQGTLQYFMFLFFLITTITISWLVILSDDLPSLSKNYTPLLSKIILSSFTIFSFAMAVVFVFKKIRSQRRTREEMILEMDILDRLISMIEDQYRRAERIQNISPVTLATISIRIRRLDKSMYAQIKNKMPNKTFQSN